MINIEKMTLSDYELIKDCLIYYGVIFVVEDFKIL